MDTSTADEGHGGERVMRRLRTLEEKLAIVREASERGASVAAVARKHEVNANLVFGWRRLQQRGLLESRRHARSVPLLPVKITMPTVLPDRASRPAPQPRVVRGDRAGYVIVEFPGGVAVRVHGRVERAT